MFYEPFGGQQQGTGFKMGNFGTGPEVVYTDVVPDGRGYNRNYYPNFNDRLSPYNQSQASNVDQDAYNQQRNNVKSLSSSCSSSDYNNNGYRKQRYFNRFSNMNQNIKNSAICTGIIMLIVAGLFIGIELHYKHKISAINAVVGQATKFLPQGDEGIKYIQDSPQDFENRIIYLNNVSVQSQNIVEEKFNFAFNGAQGLQRNVEYCQWQEYRTSYREYVGKDSNGNSIYRTHVRYYYTLDWRSYRVSSIFFQSSIAYHNPSRDPIDSKTKYTNLVLGSNLLMNSYYISDSPSFKYSEYYIPPNPNLQPTPWAFEHGFTQILNGGRWVYSHYRESGYAKWTKSIAGYALNGVIDTGISGKCTPGDIRVGWDVSYAPATYSLIGQYKSGSIMPVDQGGFDLLLAMPGNVGVSGIETAYIEDIKSTRLIWRIVLAIIFTICCIIMFCVFKRRY